MLRQEMKPYVLVGALIIMVIALGFVKSKQPHETVSALLKKAQGLVHSKDKIQYAKQLAQDLVQVEKPSKGSPSPAEALTDNPYGEWDLERLEQEATQLQITQKLNSQDLSEQERVDLGHLLLALQNKRQEWMATQMQEITQAVLAAEAEQSQKLAELREKYPNAGKQP